MLSDMSAQDANVAGVLAGVTEGLVAQRPDPATVLQLISEACDHLFVASGSGILIQDPRGGLEVVAASDERSAFVEVLQAQNQEGPCADCIRDVRAVSVADLSTAHERWPTFTPAALEAGYAAVHAIPLRLNGEAVGGLNMLYTRPCSLSSAEQQLAQALADLAVLGLSQDPLSSRRAQRLAEHTLTTLNDRVAMGQAIGMVAETLGLDSAEAQAALSSHALREGHPLRVVVRAITNRELRPEQLPSERAGGQSQSGSVSS